MIYDIAPVSKPRQTQSDKWKKRPCVLKYRAFADECRLKGIKISECGDTITFHIPMPKAWSQKKKSEMVGVGHQQRPDIDNLTKALLDAVFKEDCRVWSICTFKLWAYDGAIEIS